MNWFMDFFLGFVGAFIFMCFIAYIFFGKDGLDTILTAIFGNRK